MEGVDFDDQQYYRNPGINLPGKSGLIGWLIGRGIARDVRRANIMLASLIIVAVVASIFILRMGNSSGEHFTESELEALLPPDDPHFIAKQKAKEK